MPSPALARPRGLDALLLDLRAFTSVLRGQRLPPFTARDGRAWVGQGPQRRRLQVASVRPDGEEGVHLVLVDPAGAPLPALPGQFLTVIVPIGGQEHRRAYSLCGPPGTIALGIRRVPGGLVSGHLARTLTPGQWLEVLGPSGRYGLRPDAQAQRRLLLVSGGSGITPNLAIAHAVLESEPGSTVDLLLGDRALGTALLVPEVAALAERFPERLRVQRVLETPTPGQLQGRLDAAGLHAALRALGRDPAALDPQTEAFVCGPEPMMEAVVGALRAAGLPAGRIHTERFTASPALRQDDPRLAQAWPLTLRLGGEERSLSVRPGQTVLEAALGAGIPLPYSCAVGGCGACRLTRRAGELLHREPNSRSADDPDAVLGCCAHPLGPVELELP